MRALAERLDVAPNALYSHVDSKTALIDDVLDEVLDEVEAPPTDVANRFTGLHDLMASTYQVLLAHPDLVPAYLARQGARGPNAQRLGDVMLDLLAGLGVTGTRAREALRVLVVYTIGFAAFATRSPIETGEASHVAGEELGSNFAAGLQWLLDGIARADEDEEQPA